MKNEDWRRELKSGKGSWSISLHTSQSIVNAENYGNSDGIAE